MVDAFRARLQAVPILTARVYWQNTSQVVVDVGGKETAERLEQMMATLRAPGLPTDVTYDVESTIGPSLPSG